MPFDQWLQERIDQYGLSKYKIAKMAGVHTSTVTNWLSGTKPQVEKERAVRSAIHEWEVEHGIVPTAPTPAEHDPGIKNPPAEAGGGDAYSEKPMNVILRMMEEYALSRSELMRIAARAADLAVEKDNKEA